jgi:hypothetical protein
MGGPSNQKASHVKPDGTANLRAARMPLLVLLATTCAAVSAADYAISPEECANLQVLVDDAVFDFENRKGPEIPEPDATALLRRFEVTGSTTPFQGCELLAGAGKFASDAMMLDCDLIEPRSRSETFRADAESRQHLLDMVRQFADSISACLGTGANSSAGTSRQCGDACTRHRHEWTLKLVPPNLDVIVKVEANIPNVGALVGAGKNEFEIDASVVRRGP